MVTDVHETFWVETETRIETHSSKTEMRPRHWALCPRWDVSIQSCRTGVPVCPWRTLYSLSLDFLVNSAWPSLRAGVPVCPWTVAGLPGGRSTACHWTSWSTQPGHPSVLDCWCTSVSMDWRRPTWLTLYSLSLDFLVDNACVHHRPQHWLYHWHGSPRSATKRSLSPLEIQSATRSDVITVSSNIQDKT